MAARAELMFDYCDVTDNDPVRCDFATLLRAGACTPGASPASGAQPSCARRAAASHAVLPCAQLTSTLRSFRALALQLMRSTVTPENRVDVIQGVICLAYMVRSTHPCAAISGFRTGCSTWLHR